jgi:hypothetical protein
MIGDRRRRRRRIRRAATLDGSVSQPARCGFCCHTHRAGRKDACCPLLRSRCLRIIYSLSCLALRHPCRWKAQHGQALPSKAHRSSLARPPMPGFHHVKWIHFVFVCTPSICPLGVPLESCPWWPQRGRSGSFASWNAAGKQSPPPTCQRHPLTMPRKTSSSGTIASSSRACLFCVYTESVQRPEPVTQRHMTCSTGNCAHWICDPACHMR